MKKLFIIAFVALLFVSGSVEGQNFSEDIAPIIYNHCSNCHRPGEIGPFSLTNYNEVKSWAYSIKFATGIKYMPPWKPDPSYQNYQHENFLSDNQISSIAKWVDSGMEQGDPAKEPPFPNFPKGSQIGTPDLVLSFAKSYKHLGNGKDEYRYFVLPTNLTEDKDLIALEMRPGNKKIVHHTLFWADNTGKARAEDAKSPEYGYTGGSSSSLSGEQLPGYVPGQKPNFYTNGMSQRIPKGSDLVLQMHFAPTSIDEKDSSVVNLFFAKSPAPRQVFSKILLPYDLVNGPFIISPNQVKEFHAVYKVPTQVSLMGIWPHCHMLGKRWEAYAKLPNGTQIPLVKINDWDFNWQGGYYFNKLIVLPANSEIHAFCTYDNTTNNPVNPFNPPKLITWGEGTTAEMFYLPISFVLYQNGDESLVINTSDPNFKDSGFEQISEKVYPIYPNPNPSNEITVGFVLNQNRDIQIDLTTDDGKKVANLQKKQYYFQGQHSVQLKLPELVNGHYLVKIISAEKVLTEQLVVLR